MKKICEFDQVEFEAKRSTAKYCSTNCRVKAAQAAGVNPNTGEVMELTDSKDNKIKKTDVTGTPLDWKRYADPNDPLYEPNPFKRPKDPNYDEEKNLKAFIKMGLREVNWLSTGIPELDELTKIPRGRVTQIQGPYAVGKTTLCLNMISGMKGIKTLYIDTEAALNPELLMKLGIDRSMFDLYNESAFIEDIAELIRDAAKSGKYDLIVLDSVPTTTTKTIADTDITAKNIGQKAAIIHKLMSWITMDLKRTDTAMVFINQEREVLGSYVPMKYTPGGMGIPYQASLMIALKSIKSWRFPQKPKDGIYEGQEVEATIIKSKVNQPWRTKKFKLYYPTPVKVDEAGPTNAEKEAF